MPLTLLTGPHQAGKSRRLWELLRVEPPGTAVLVRPGGLTRELVRQVHAWCGPGWLPAVLSLPELAERAAAALGDAPQVLSDPWVRHALRRWNVDGLDGSPWVGLAPYRRTARELADLLLRLDAQGVSDGELELLLRRAVEPLNGKLRALVRARRWLRNEAERRGAATAGARWAALADAPLPWAAIYLDDMLAMTPAEAEWLAGIARHRRVVVAAIDDDRCSGGLLDRLRVAAPDALEERLTGLHAQAPYDGAQRALLPALLPPGGEAPALPVEALPALDRYRYRDPVHAGRALAAWFAARHVPPAQVNLYLRVCDGEALALADALRAAGVPVSGRFHLAYGATAAGAVVAALGRLLARPTWERFRAFALRLPSAAPLAVSAPPTPLIELDGPWSSVEEALAALTTLAAEGTHGDVQVAVPLRAALGQTVVWLRKLHLQLPTDGSWFARLTQAASTFDLPLADMGPALAALDALHPVDEADLIDALAEASVEVVRDDGPDSLAILDAVRGRSQPRAVAVIHGLEHGRWPVQPGTGVLLAPEDRAQLGGDWFDERGRVAGELAAFLACAGRGLSRLVLGIPCGERQPSAWLATIAEQAGWDLEQLRGEPDAEAVAGAPLGPADSRGDHELALWGRVPRQPSLVFRVPPCAPPDLRLRVSSLDLALGDSFALVCQRLALGSVLQDRRLLEDGNLLHELLAGLAAHPPAEWPGAFESLLDDWIGSAADELERAARRQRAPRLRQVVAAESAAAAEATVAAEQRLPVPLDLGELGTLTLSGRVDRIDRHGDGTLTVVDYKRGAAASQRAKVVDQREAQVLAYIQALRAQGQVVREGVFVPLAAGKRVAVSLEDAAERWARVCTSVAALAQGEATAFADGACPPAVIRAAEYTDQGEHESGEGERLMPWSLFTAEQHRAAFLVDRHVLASAGAGSGKTTVMAVRYVACLLDGLVPPDRILALAFTVEAAGNLRTRIDRTLRQVLRRGTFPKPGRAAEEEDDLQLTETERTHLRRALVDLPSAPITTVDGACLAWVREGAGQLGRDPDVGPAEAVAWADLRARAWQRLRREAAVDLVPLIARHGEHQVRSGLLAKTDQAAALPSGSAFAAVADPCAELLRRRAPQLASLPAVLAAAGQRPLPDPVADRAGFCERLAELDVLRAAGKAKEATQAVQDLLDFPAARKADGKRPDKGARRRRGSLLTLIEWDPALEADLASDAARVVRLVDRLRTLLAEESAAAGVAGFSAIAAEALALLADPAIARRLATRYRHVLLDEAQDLNRLQARLVDALLESEPSAGGPRVFTVGDHRQSIFGFRHAAPEVFAGWKDVLPARGGTVAVLRENFRSHPGLVLGIKDLFGDPVFQPEDIVPGREGAGEAVLAAWRVEAPEEVDDPQTEFVAERIAISSRRPEDHAILLRSRTHMAAYARALERRGIPCDTDFPEGLIASQEVADIEAVLRLALAAHDRDALAVALGGPWGTPDPNDKRLLVEALEGDPARALHETPLGAVVARTRHLAAAEGPGPAVHALATDPLLTARYGELPLARRRLANLQSLAEEEHRAGRTLDLAEFCQRLRDRRRHGVDEAEASGAALGGRGVRLMTIHGSKGLEWPVVWLPELDRAHGTQDLRQAFPALPDGDALRVCVKPGPHDEGVSLAAELAADDLRLRQVAEEKRLFYVACTRAREELHLVLAKEPSPPDARGLTAAPGGWVSLAWQPVVLDPALVTQRKPDPPPAIPPAVPVPLPEQPTLLPLVSVTELAEGSAAAAAGSGASEEWLRKLIGTTVHEAFARFGIGMGDEQARRSLEELAPLLAVQPGRHANLLAALTDPELVPGYWAGERLVEQPLIGERHGQVVSAQVDLLLKRDGAWHLYDFKTGNAAQAASSAVQVRLYAELAAPLLDAPLAGCWLVDVERHALIAVPMA